MLEYTNKAEAFAAEREAFLTADLPVEELQISVSSSSCRRQTAEMDMVMARLTDSNGLLLGGLDTSPNRLLHPPCDTKPVALLAPPAPPLTPEYGPDEIVFALECSYGSLAYLTYSSTTTPPGAESRPTVQLRDCQKLIEEPQERHYCPACGGYYCAKHTDLEAHDCRAVLQRKPTR